MPDTLNNYADMPLLDRRVVDFDRGVVDFQNIHNHVAGKADR
jgi:hypothetical protein